MATIALRGLTRRFATTAALDQVDLTLPDGSFTALVGPSGCGKSTLLRLVAGLDRPSAGAVVADGRPVDGRSEEHTSELQSLMRISYAVFCLKKKKKDTS